MDEVKQDIINLFREKGNEISTADILEKVYPEESNLRNKNSKENKRKLAQVHRKLLYHINELVSSGILRFSKFGEKGLKFFVLDIMDGEEITELTPRYKKKMVISKPIIPSLPIEGYEHQGIIIKYNANTWIDKINSAVIMCDKLKDIIELSKLFDKSFDVVNDCLCFDRFENMIENSKDSEIIGFLEKVSSECKDFGKKASFIINLSKIKKSNLKEIVERLTDFKSEEIEFIYDIDSDNFQEQFGLINEIISVYIKKKATFYIKNRKLQKSAYYLGLAGPYCISDKERQEKENCLVFACGQSSLIVDVERFYSIYGLDVEKFSQLMLNISKAFLSANSIQRRKSQEYFKGVISFDKKNEKEFLEFSRNYIRFWNFGLQQPGVDPKLVLNMINEAKKKVEQFSIAEETIYKSCGMPLRFKLALSCAFKTSDEKLSQAKYEKIEINNLEDLYKTKIKKQIIDRESVSSMFEGGNDVTFHRNGIFNPEDIAREISFILNTYKIPMFSYNFKNIKGDMKITSYI